MKALILFLLFLTGSNAWARQTLELRFVCGEEKAGCIPMKTLGGEDLWVQPSSAVEWASADVAEIHSVKGDGGQPVIQLSLSGEAAKKFADLTRANLSRRLAIVAAGTIVTAPTIRAPIEGGPLQIAAGSNQVDSPLLSIPWVRTRLATENSAAVSVLKTKAAFYVAFGLVLMVGALWFVFFRRRERPEIGS